MRYVSPTSLSYGSPRLLEATHRGHDVAAIAGELVELRRSRPARRS